MANAILHYTHLEELSVLNYQNMGLKLKQVLEILNENEDNALANIPLRPHGHIRQCK